MLPGAAPPAGGICGMVMAPPFGAVAATVAFAAGGGGGAEPPQPESTKPARPHIHNIVASDWCLEVFTIDIVL